MSGYAPRQFNAHEPLLNAMPQLPEGVLAVPRDDKLYISALAPAISQAIAERANQAQQT